MSFFPETTDARILAASMRSEALKELLKKDECKVTQIYPWVADFQDAKIADHDIVKAMIATENVTWMNDYTSFQDDDHAWRETPELKETPQHLDHLNRGCVHKLGQGGELPYGCSSRPAHRNIMFDLIEDIARVPLTVSSNIAGTVYKVATDTGTTAAKIIQDNVNTVFKVGMDISSTGVKIVSDLVGALAQVGSGFTSTAMKIRGDTVSTLAKSVSDTSSTSSKFVNDSQTTVNKMKHDAGTTVLKIRDDINTLKFQAANLLLKYATNVFAAAGDAAVVDAILQVIHRSLEVMTQSLSGVLLIWRGIFTNGTNDENLAFILNHLYDLLWFLYDLVRSGNVIPGYLAADGTIEYMADEQPGIDNPYNEFDLRLEQNRDAVIYQVQRVTRTLTAILRMGRERVLPNGLGDLRMNASLSSDFDSNGNPPSSTYMSRLGGEVESPPNEKWLFINGIANEYVWFQRSCDKIRDTFKREVKGVYNRSDGILWDMIECCGEHSAVTERSNELIALTRSSKDAQESLERELKEALWPTNSNAPDKVVMIAHSQGCLLLRLVLQKLVRDHAKSSQKMRDMKERLRVFTFGNPSLDWRVIRETDECLREYANLSEYAKATEHFAHEVDFVAMLGVVTHRDDQNSGYDRVSVFYSHGGRGHLFGAHYPLVAGAYKNGENSQLLRAVNGKEIV
ncbi:hypothetical protein TGAM01_v204220 [Trichoderma gamsii]|uniref:DUF676 domain-containing protein n=1 Tax=Trichoderma gamsii TaxID=398673 RepID=A0A2P4ZQZ4_9HYPO|nr:hypothetical protein TGAM01_v204220 [Trichoderma gamsii]PON26719.1 hypothetical protein TGAM01_v204220 [Trichoderma gamsii]